MRVRRKQAAPGFRRNNWLDQAPGFRYFSTNNHNFRIEAVDESGYANSQVARGFADRVGSMLVAHFHQFHKLTHSGCSFAGAGTHFPIAGKRGLVGSVKIPATALSAAAIWSVQF